MVVFLMEEKMDFLKELPGEEETEETGEEEGKVSDLPEISLFNTHCMLFKAPCIMVKDFFLGVWYKSGPAQASS